MDIDFQKVDVGTQTESFTDITVNSFGAITTSSNATFNTNSSTSFPTTTSDFTEALAKTSIELPFYRVLMSHKTCSICGKNFSGKNTSKEINQSIRVQCLLDHHIYMPTGSRCCSSQNADAIRKTKLIQKIKENKLNYCTIKRDEFMIILNEMKVELKIKDDKINELNESPPFNFDDDETPVSDTNYHVLTGLTRDQFNDLCSEIPPSALRHNDIRTPRTAIA